MTVLAATAWNTNADLMLDVKELGYLEDGPNTIILDLTYGKGNWWNKWRPAGLFSNDLDPDRPTDFDDDFTATRWEDGYWDAVVYDPPYVCIGGRKTTNLGDFHDRFGLLVAPKTPALLQELINDGLTEAARICKPKGYILAKCADYISSGKLWIGTHHTMAHGLELGLKVQDRFEMVATRRRAQPPMRNGKPFVQQHAGRNLSTLIVFRKPR